MTSQSQSTQRHAHTSFSEQHTQGCIHLLSPLWLICHWPLSLLYSLSYLCASRSTSARCCVLSISLPTNTSPTRVANHLCVAHSPYRLVVLSQQSVLPHLPPVYHALLLSPSCLGIVTASINPAASGTSQPHDLFQVLPFRR